MDGGFGSGGIGPGEGVGVGGWGSGGRGPGVGMGLGPPGSGGPGCGVGIPIIQVRRYPQGACSNLAWAGMTSTMKLLVLTSEPITADQLSDALPADADPQHAEGMVVAPALQQ